VIGVMLTKSEVPSWTVGPGPAEPSVVVGFEFIGVELKGLSTVTVRVAVTIGLISVVKGRVVHLL
jgi:hypothetical protein